MPTPDRQLATAVWRHIKQHRGNAAEPFYLAIDGRSGSGKSTLAAQLQALIGVDHTTVIDGDSFYCGGSAARWDTRTAAQNADAVINRQLLKQVIRSLQTTGAATWSAFDWHNDNWDSDNPPAEHKPRAACEKPWVIVEGVYTAHPALASLFHYAVLLDCCKQLSQRRTRARDADDYCPAWAQRWTEAEDCYFSQLAPGERFDLVLSLPVSI
ncbi:MAG: hypothetical protein AAF404_03150 [Pseudomonadota bacterium]